MAAVESMPFADLIGKTAGAVWQILETNGPTKITKLVKHVGAPRDVVMQSIGWLAREEKIWIEEDSRSRVVSIA